MAARVNSKFVALLVVVLVAVVGLGFLAYWKLYHRTVDQLRVEGERHLVEARRHAAEVDTLSGDAALSSYRRSGEEFREATSLFGQAFTKEPTNLEVLQNYIDALSQMHAPTRIRAEELHRELMDKRKLAVELSGNAPERLEAYFQGLMAMAPWAGPGIYQAVFREAENRLAVNPEDPISMKYRASWERCASTRARTSTSSARCWTTSRRPGRSSRTTPSWRWRWRATSSSRPSACRPTRPPSTPPSTRPSKRSPRPPRPPRRTAPCSSPGRRRSCGPAACCGGSPRPRAQQGVGQARVDEIVARADALDARLAGAVERLEASVKTDPDIDDLVRTADLLTATDREQTSAEGDVISTGGLQRTEALVRAAIQAEPLNVSYKVMLGNLLRLRQQHDEALAVYREADALDATGPSEMMLRTEARRRQARFEIASIELIKAEAAADPDERERLLTGAEEAVAELVNAENRTARVLLLEGKIALLRNETTKAMQALDKAVEIYASSGQPNVEAILLSARARQAERQWGAAAERLEDLLQRYPLDRSPATEQRIRRQLTEIYLAAGRTQAAARQVERLATLAPDEASTEALRGQLALESGSLDEAAGVFRDAGLLGNAGVLRRLADGYRRAGQEDRAEALLRGFLTEEPANLGVLAELLPRVDAEERESLLAAAEAAGADEENLLLLRGSDDPADRQRMVDTLASRGGGDDFDEQLRRANLWTRLQEPEKAEAAFERARQLQPDSPRLLMEDLRLALAAEEMDRAASLAERASRENLDLVGGRFIRAQVAAAQGDTGRAIALYREGLQERPIYDQGWKTLGDLHLREGAAAEAAEAYSQATRQRPDNVGAFLGLAEAQRMRGREGAALAALRSAVDVNPENVAVRESYLAYEVQRGDPQRAIEFRRDRANRQPDELGNRIALARLLGERGSTDEAIEELDEAAQRPGAGPSVAAAKAELLAEAQGVEAGVAEMEAYLTGRGDALDAADLIASGRFLAGVGRDDEATEAFRRAAALEPADDPARVALRELGDHLFATGRASEAAEVYRELLASDTLASADRERVTLRQAETLLRAGDADGAEALLRETDTGVEGLLLRALIARQRGDTATARASIEAALEAAPESPTALLQRATLPDAAPEAALADATRASELNPDDPAADRVRVGILVGTGRRAEAAEVLDARLNRDPADQQARVSLIELRLAENRPDEARALVEAGRRLDPDAPLWDRIGQQVAASASDDAVALPALRSLLAEREDPETLARLADRLLAAGEPQAAGEELEARPALVQDNPVLQALRGRALADGGDAEAARNVLRAAVLPRPAPPANWLGGARLRPPRSVFCGGGRRRSPQEQPPEIEPASIALVQASTLASGGDWAGTLRALLDAGRSGDGDSDPRRLRMRATTLQNLDRPQEAREAVRAAARSCSPTTPPRSTTSPTCSRRT